MLIMFSIGFSVLFPLSVISLASCSAQGETDKKLSLVTETDKYKADNQKSTNAVDICTFPTFISAALLRAVD